MEKSFCTQPIVPTSSEVLSKAVIRTSQRLNISENQISQILSLSLDRAHNLFLGAYLLNETKREWNQALLFIRMYRSLDSITGDDQIAQRWLLSLNNILLNKPINLITHLQGLASVVAYLEKSKNI